LLLSVTAESVPRVEESVTAPAEDLRLSPFASFAWTVTVADELPSANREAGEAEIVLFPGETGPGTVVIAPLVPVRLVLSVAVTV